jgi:hypothetical protein
LISLESLESGVALCRPSIGVRAEGDLNLQLLPAAVEGDLDCLAGLVLAESLNKAVDVSALELSAAEALSCSSG